MAPRGCSTRWAAKERCPRSLGNLQPRFKTPWTAQHLIFGTSIFATLLWPSWLDGNIVRAFVWWAGAIAFFALLTYLFVNLANLLYFNRIDMRSATCFTNVLVPIIGLIVDGYVLYKAFFESLWNVPDFRDGKAIILFCLSGRDARDRVRRLDPAGGGRLADPAERSLFDEGYEQSR